MSSHSDWTSQTRRSIVWSNAAFIGARAFSSLSILVLARLLTPAEFGVIAAITVYVGIVELISDVGMRATVIYEQEKTITRRVDTAFTINFGLAILLSVACVLLAPFVASFFRLEEHTDLFRLAALNPFLKGLGNIHDALLMRAMQFRRRAIPEVIQAATRSAVSIPLAFAGFGASGLLIGFLAGTAVWTVTLWGLTGYRPHPSFDRKIARSMVGYGVGASLVDIQSELSSRIDLIAIGRVLGDKALGLYTVAFRVPELLIEAVGWNTGTVAFAALSQKRRDNESGLADATRSLIRYQALYAIPVGAILAVLGTPMIVTLFGSSWEEAGGVASAVAVMAAVTTITFPLGDVFKALGRQRVLVVLQWVSFPFLIAAVLATAPAGIVAVAWARAAVRAVYVGLLTIVVSRTLRETVRSMVAPMLPATIAGVGALAGAGAVRLLWSDASFGPLIAGCAAGVAGAALALALFAPSTLRELRQLMSALLKRNKGDTSASQAPQKAPEPAA